MARYSIEASTDNPLTMFLLNGLEVPKGEYTIEYGAFQDNSGTPENVQIGIVNKFTGKPLVPPSLFSAYDDGTTDFASTTALVTHLASILEINASTTSSINDFDSEVALGGIAGTVTIQKFAFNNDIDTASTEVLAAFGGAWADAQIITTAQTLTITYNNTTDGSSGTGARMLQIDYLDANNELQTAFHTLGSTGSDTTSFTCLGVNRAVVVSFGGDSSNGNDITLTATTLGSVQAEIPAGLSVTQQLIYHTPINNTLLLNGINFDALKISGGGGSPRVTFKIWSYSRVTGGVYEFGEWTIDTSVTNSIVRQFEEPIVLGGREVIYVEVETDVNNTAVSGRFFGNLFDTSIR
jgi:hypothetical protein